MPAAATLDQLTAAITTLRPARASRATLVALSGIDASGKGYVAQQLAGRLEHAGLRVAPINLDGWLTLPEVRFNPEDPAAHFYRHAFRFDEMFSTLVDPLVSSGQVSLVADYTEETATSYRSQTYSYEGVDTVLLEGIFLLRTDIRPRYDLAVWIECSFETALQRAIVRAQEGLSPEETVAAFERIYFPAQRLHFDLDAPRESADFLFINDERLRAPAAAARVNGHNGIEPP